MGFDFSVFIGRFHPLFVHLPIGIIIITLIMDLWGKAGKKILSWMWFFSFATALLSIFTGFQLSQGSSYPGNDLFWHKWLGISVAVISLMIWIMNRLDKEPKTVITNGLKIGVIVLLSIGGHKGGQLTHGNDYLVEAAPSFIKKLAGYKGEPKVDLSNIHSDSIASYEHLIYPIFEAKCIQCHNENAASGDLIMTSREKIMEGGDSGDAIISGDASKSEIFKRVTLSQSSLKFMPTKGIPMSYNEMQLLKWWIDGGADFQEKAIDAKMSKEVISSIHSLYNVDFTPRPWYEKEKGPKIDSSAFSSLEDQGFKLTKLSHSDNFIEVSNPSATIEGGLGLVKLKDNVFILDLKKAQLSDAVFDEISELKNMIRLQLQETNTSSEDIKKIAPLPRLEAINLFGSMVDDEALEHLSKFPRLKRVYTWKTNVTDEGISLLNEKRPDIEVIKGI